MDELLQAFVEDALEGVEFLNRDLLALEQGSDRGPDKETLERLFRTVHNLKGAAQAVSLPQVAAACHAAETYMQGVLERGALHSGTTYLFALADALQDTVRRLQGGEPLEGSAITRLHWPQPSEIAASPGPSAAHAAHAPALPDVHARRALQIEAQTWARRLERQQSDDARLAQLAGRLRDAHGDDSAALERVRRLDLARQSYAASVALLHDALRGFCSADAEPANTTSQTQQALVTETPARTQVTPTTSANSTVLVVDDSGTMRTMQRKLLEEHGYAVVTQQDGEAAWQWLQTHCPAAVITDVEMPRRDGLSLTSAIRSERRFDHVPVLIVTALASDLHATRSRQVGADTYIVKGNDGRDELLERLEQLLRSRARGASGL